MPLTTRRSWLLPGLAIAACVLLGGHARDARSADPPSSAPQSTPPQQSSEDTDSETPLETVIVTGSLIPQRPSQQPVPLTVITAEDMQARGFSTVAEALQQSAFANGSVEGPQTTNGFTPAAQTLSLFGLSPSYVKYLIDGRPMSDYPSLYDSTGVIVSITGIPQALVDHIDLLPGGESSLYGSDAIAGVVNIVLKKHLDAPILDARYGFYQAGGGIDRRLAFADSFSVGSSEWLAGVQYERQDPIWGYQRSLTSHYDTSGSTPVTAEQDWIAFGFSGTPYYFLDPNNCTNVANQFGGTVGKYTLPGSGSYCGTTTAGYYTLDNAVESVQGYLSGSLDITDHLGFYTEALYSHDATSIGNSAGYWSTGISYGAFYDPNLGQLLNLAHLFTPEEAGSLQSTEDRVFTDSYRVTLGARGALAGGWSYDINATHTEERLIRRNHVTFTSGVDAYYSSILGPNLGLDPIYGAFPVFSPNYAAFYEPLTPAQYASLSGNASVRQQTWDTMFRAQLLGEDLFKLPGGSAAFAAAVETANQGWSDIPDADYTDGEIYEYESSPNAGQRSRQAATTELRLPVLGTLSFVGSGRFDNYHVSGGNVNKATYTFGTEFHLIRTLLFRGRYGTAFKAPTLPEEFQTRTGFGTGGTDYYQCATQGYTGANIGNCPEYEEGFLGYTSGNLKLQPITARVWDAGAVWNPIESASVSVDYLQWAINNEVAQESTDQLLRTESLCRLGTYDITSPTCVAALSQVMRDPITGYISSVFTPEVNVSHENVGAMIASAHYGISVNRFGNLALQATWNDELKHTYQMYPGDPLIDELRDPTCCTDFKSKVNGSVDWNRGNWAATTYIAWYGRTPNYLATVNGYDTPGAGTVRPWTVVNASVRFQVTAGLTLSLVADNAFNRMPPVDHSYPGFASAPYNNENYNIFGRSFLLQVQYKLLH
jgi:iron complex outermembrane receptor protein